MCQAGGMPPRERAGRLGEGCKCPAMQKEPPEGEIPPAALAFFHLLTGGAKGQGDG